MRVSVLFLLFISTTFSAFAQEEMDSVVYADSLVTALADSIMSEDEEVRSVVYKALPDSVVITKRSFSQEQINELKQDPNLDYQQPPTVAESIWDRIMMWIARLIRGFFEAAFDTGWGRILAYIVGLTLVVVLVMMLLKVDAFRMLFTGTPNTYKYQVLEENIHEMNFDQLIREAVDEQNFRKAIRLLFLYSLKLMTDRDLIHWETGKTNHDYVRELSSAELKRGFSELSFYFDYAWYGNFSVNRETYSKVENVFNDLRKKL